MSQCSPPTRGGATHVELPDPSLIVKVQLHFFMQDGVCTKKLGVSKPLAKGGRGVGKLNALKTPTNSGQKVRPETAHPQRSVDGSFTVAFAVVGLCAQPVQEAERRRRQDALQGFVC